MSISLETRVASEIGWNWQDSTPGSENSEAGNSSSLTKTQGQLRRQFSFSTSSEPSVNAVWFAENAKISPFSSITFDLSRMLMRIYGTDIPVRFATLCSISLFNRSEMLSLVISHSGSTVLASQSGGFLNLAVPPGGFFTFCNPKADWNVSSLGNEFQLRNAYASEIRYDLFLNGFQNDE